MEGFERGTDCFEDVTEQYEKMIHCIIKSLNIYKNKDEFFQIGLIALWEAKTRFNHEKGCFSSYAYSFIKGRILSELGKTKRYEERNICCDEQFWGRIENDYGTHSPEVSFLLSYCDHLSDNQKKWVLYTCLDGLSIREIAEKEQVSPSAVKAWRKGARVKLKDCLEIRD